MPLANALLTQNQLGEPEACYPLDLTLCPHCTLVQIAQTVAPEKLFREYAYLSSCSETMLNHAKALVNRVIAMQDLNANSLVVEIASNDGYLLQYYRAAQIPVLGIEPAVNVARIALEERQIPSISQFFSDVLARQLQRDGVEADIIHAHNVLAHVADLNGVVSGLSTLMKKTGIAVIEVPYVKDMVDQCAFDTIYHEHLCYFSLTALVALFCRHDLQVTDVEQVGIHGGSLRLYVRHRAVSVSASSTVERMLRQEKELGIGEPGFYKTLTNRVVEIGHRLGQLLKQLKSEGSRIAAYGASAKGTMLLNFFRIGRETIDYVVDRNPIKQGLYTPGTHLSIYPPEKLLEDLPEYTLLLTWNFADEILKQQAEYRQRGGRFISPIPEPRILEPRSSLEGGN
jgi:SAM-dependent methyltransferase